MKKKLYSAPVIKSESIQIGVFGKYGSISVKPRAWPRRRNYR
jgi:hypothetical protein